MSGCGGRTGFLLALGIGLSACDSRVASRESRGVLVIAIDALRADHVRHLGYDRDTTPALDALARDGLSFRQAFTSSPQLLPAHVALLTGCEPTLARRFLPNEFEGVSERRWRIPDGVPHLAVELLAAGYATAAFVDDPMLSAAHGFGPGFQEFEILTREDAQAWEGSQPVRVVDRFLQWLRSVEHDRPWFAYLHLHHLDRFWSEPPSEWEAFFPARPELADVPPVGNTDSVFFALPRSRLRGAARPLGQYEAGYDGEVRALDNELQRLFASLRRLGRFDSASVHVLGSYGLQFGEAGLYLRAGRYSMADLNVPWVLRPRAGLDASRGRVVDELVSLVDLAPTVLALEGLTLPAGMHGLSQSELALDPASRGPARPFVIASCGMQEGCAVIGARHCAEYLLPAGTEDAQLRRSWFGEWVDLAVTPSPRFYDRLATPYPALEGLPPGGDELAPYRAAALEWFGDMNDARVFLQSPPGRSGLDEESIRRLREKGYVGPQR